MKQKKQFAAGIALLAVYGVYNFRFELPFYAYTGHIPGYSLSTLLEYLLYDPVGSPMVGRLIAIFGFILLASHYYNVDGKERQVYRLLDRVASLVLLACAGGLLIFFRLFLREPSLHIGFLLVLQRTLFLLLTIVVMLWAYALWRARAGMALLFSVLCAALILSPALPYNNPLYLEESHVYWQQQYGANVDTEQALSVESDDAIEVDYTQTVIYEDDRMELLTFLLLLTYTWMRWGGVYKKDDDKTDEEEACSECDSQSKG